MEYNNSLFLKDPIFSDACKDFLGSSYPHFEELFYREYITFLFIGEYTAAIAYPLIANYVKSGKYGNNLSNIGEEHLLLLQDYLQDMGEEENTHSLFIESFLNKKFNIRISSEKKQHFSQFSKVQVDNSSLLDILVYYHLGECNFWTGLYLVFKSTSDDQFKKFLHNLLIDESRHIHNIHKVFKLIKNKVTIDKNYYFEQCNYFKFLNYEFIKLNFNLQNNDLEKEKILKHIYDHDWHRNFNRIFLKKSFKSFNLFYPDETFENFFKNCNAKQQDWLPYKD